MSVSPVRRAAIWVLVVVSAVSVSAAAVVGWARATALDTDTYVETSTAIFGDRDVQAAITEYLVEAVLDVVDVEELAASALPDGLSFLSGPAEQVARRALEEVVETVLSRPEVADVVEWFNREAHERVVAILRDDHPYLRVEGDELVLDLDAALEEVAETVQGWGIPLFTDGVPDGAGELALVSAPVLADAKDAVDILDVLQWVLPLVALLAALGAVALSSRRLYAVGLVGCATAAAALVTLGLEAAVQWSVISSITDPIEQLAGETLWEIASNSLILRLVGLALAGGVVAAVGLLADRSRGERAAPVG